MRDGSPPVGSWQSLIGGWGQSQSVDVTLILSSSPLLPITDYRNPQNT